MQPSSVSLSSLGDPSSSHNSGKHFHPCSTGFQHVMLSKWAYFYIWAMRSVEFNSSQPVMVVGSLEQMSAHVAALWVLIFGILHKSVWRWASLALVSILLYSMHVQFLSCNGHNLVAIPSHSDVQKDLDDPLHSSSPGYACSLRSDWMLLYRHSQCSCGR